MKKILLLVIGLVFTLLYLPFVTVHAQEAINSFNAVITINADGTISVTEQLNYDFGSAERHGIIRDIPLIKTNTEGKKFKLDVAVESVLNTIGQPYTFTTTQANDMLSIKIGDPDVTVTGEQQYIIIYTIGGALTYFTDHDELYWNITGNEWGVPIENASATIIFPDSVPATESESTCFTGVPGSTQSKCRVITYTDDENTKGLLVSSEGDLSVGEGLTVVVGFPKGHVQQLEPQQISTLFAELISFVKKLFFITLIIGWYVITPSIIMWRWFKDKKNTTRLQRIVTAWFDPPKNTSGSFLTPAETAVLVDGALNHQKITATIISLAQKGLLKINVTDKDNIEFEKLGDYTSEPGLEKFEKTLLKALFNAGDDNSVTTADLKKSLSFGQSIKIFQKEVAQSLKTKKLVKRDLYALGDKAAVLTSFGLLTLNLFLVLVSRFMLKKLFGRTTLGIEKYSEAKSLENFLVSQDEKLDFQAQNQMFFEKLLPYATAFGVEDIWAKRFKDLEFSHSEWYQSTDNKWNSLAMSNLSNTIGNSITSANKYANYKSGSSSSGFSSGFSGGGSSGGGGGGGGGRSW